MKKSESIKLAAAAGAIALAGLILAWQFLWSKPPPEAPVQASDTSTTGIPDASGKEVKSGRSGSVFVVPEKGSK